MTKNTTQQFLEFEQIREGIMILKNKALRAILMVSSLNFALKSDDEQNAILYQFQNFMNSLDFSCQILVHSRRLNIASYLDKLKEIGKKEENDLLKIQIEEYSRFIEEIMAEGSIMQKVFYVVVPFTLLESRKTSSESKFKFPVKIPTLTEEEFVALGMRSCGLQAVPLNTQEMIELLWSFYHPQEAERGYYPEIPPELATQ
jgi:hypothetical protein